MKLRQCAFLADENIHADVVAYLLSQGCDTQSVAELGLRGASDRVVIERAFQSKRVVLTHDSDFGELMVLHQQWRGAIVYLRPGHIDPVFTIQTLAAALECELSSPFILVARHDGDGITIRIRHPLP